MRSPKGRAKLFLHTALHSSSPSLTLAHCLHSSSPFLTLAHCLHSSSPSSDLSAPPLSYPLQPAPSAQTDTHCQPHVHAHIRLYPHPSHTTEGWVLPRVACFLDGGRECSKGVNKKFLRRFFNSWTNLALKINMVCVLVV